MGTIKKINMQVDKDLGVVRVNGQEFDRSELHQDPFRNQELEVASKEKQKEKL